MRATLLLTLLLVGCDEDDVSTALQGGELNVLTYNVAGLPQGISGSDPEANIPQISPRLNAYDLALVQEDFWYQPQLRAEVDHPHVTEVHTSGARPGMPDGLNRFSRSPFDEVVRVPWVDCNGRFDCSSDCLANKGFSVARHTLGPGVEVDVYNLHKEAGGCPEDEVIRARGVDQLLESLGTRSAGVAVLMGGDFNLHEEDAPEVALLRKLEAEGGLRDACWALDCGETNIDRVFLRSSDMVTLEPLSWEVPAGFLDGAGEDLSDHEPVAVRVRWKER